MSTIDFDSGLEALTGSSNAPPNFDDIKTNLKEILEQVLHDQVIFNYYYVILAGFLRNRLQFTPNLV